MLAGLSSKMEPSTELRFSSSDARKAFFRLIFPDVRVYDPDQYFPGRYIPVLTCYLYLLLRDQTSSPVRFVYCMAGPIPITQPAKNPGDTPFVKPSYQNTSTGSSMAVISSTLEFGYSICSL